MTGTGPADGGIAARLSRVLQPLLRGPLPIRLRAWDGSEAGDPAGPLVVLGSVQALRRILRHPGELGAAQAYVTGELDVPETDGWDLDAALTHVWRVAAERGLTSGGLLRDPRAWSQALRDALRTLPGLGVVGPVPPAPASQARVGGRLHTPERDRRAISHHYDLAAEFYALLLDESMAYSCGYFRQPRSPSYTVADAQSDKLSLVCDKLGLEPGTRLLDVGCGWGSLALHAAEAYGADVTAITIAAEQQAFVEKRVAEHGLTGRVRVHLCDYRDAPTSIGSGFDAVGSIEMGEHVGRRNYPAYAAVLRDCVAPGGRVLVQQMSRGQGARGGGRHPGGGPFIESFIAPDMHMRPVGETLSLLERAGLEARDVHGMREHYVHTVDGWLETFRAREAELTALVGEEVVRVWRLYLTGGRMAFRDARMGVDQILLTRPGAEHTLPAVRGW